MRNRRIKVIWGASDVILGQWYFGLFGFYDQQSGLAISVRGILRWGLMMAALGYFAAALALGYFWQKNPYNRLTFSDALFYPIRRADIAVKKGQAFIAEGHEMLKERKWGDGARLLRAGLALCPGELEARQALARFHLLANQRPLAVKVLGEGLAREFPGQSYLAGLFDLAEQGEDFDFVVATADRYLPLLSGDAALIERRWLTGRKFDALLAGQRKPEALELALAEEPGEMASEHRVLGLVELGRASEAAEYLETWSKRSGANLPAVYRLQVRVSREMKQFEAMDLALGKLRSWDPADPAQAVYGVVQRAMAGRDAAAKLALEDFLFRFGGTSPNLQLAADPLAEIGQRELLERCIVAGKEQGFRLQPLRAQRVQIYVRRGEWTEAAAELDLMKAAPGETLAPLEQYWWDWMSRLVAVATNKLESAQISFLDYLRERAVPMKLCRFSIEALRMAGRIEVARDVIAITERSYPASRWAQSQKAEVEKKLQAQRSAKVMAAADILVEEGVFFERLDAFMLERKWTEAETLIHDLRGNVPPVAWLERRDGDLRWADVRINHGRGELPRLLASARVYLNGNATRSQRIIELARERYSSGDKNGAKGLVQIVLQRSPDFPAAMDLNAQLESTKSHEE